MDSSEVSTNSSTDPKNDETIIDEFYGIGLNDDEEAYNPPSTFPAAVKSESSSQKVGSKRTKSKNSDKKVATTASKDKDIRGILHSKFDPFEEKSYQTESGDPSASAYDTFLQLQRQNKEAKLDKIVARDKDGSLTNLHRILSLMPNFNEMTRDEIVDLLYKSVIYNEDDLVMINKPPNLASQDGPKIMHSVAGLCKPLAQRLGSDYLQIIHRLDKQTSGCMMLAKSQKKFLEIKQCFVEKRITKHYWALVRNIPESPEGIIKIPIRECEVGGRMKMVLAPIRMNEMRELSSRKHSQRGVMAATTEYETIAAGTRVSLVACKSQDGIKHQIRCHLGFGIGCPVLGDHKYSNFLKYQPQRLPSEVLHRLGIRSSKSRHLPLYLHARELVIPDYYSSGFSLMVKAKLPKFFVYTLKKLALRL